jgi:hypothetical protein
VCREEFNKRHYDDNVPSKWINPEFLRQEEEENMQDMVAEQRQHQEQKEEEEIKSSIQMWVQ